MTPPSNVGAVNAVSKEFGFSGAKMAAEIVRLRATVARVLSVIEGVGPATPFGGSFQDGCTEMRKRIFEALEPTTGVP